MQSHGLFTPDEHPTKQFFKNHLPKQLFKHFEKLKLIDGEKHNFQLNQHEQIEIHITKDQSSVYSEKLNQNVKFDTVWVRITETNNNVAKNKPALKTKKSKVKGDLPDSNDNTIESTSYLFEFINQNAYFSGCIDNKGWDYPGPVNYYALLPPGNTNSEKETNEFITAIEFKLAKVTSKPVQLEQPIEGQAASAHKGCGPMR